MDVDETGFLLSPSEGGRARARALPADERSRIAREAAQARWLRDAREAAFTGALIIGDKRIACAVLDDGTRVLAQGTVLAALGRASSMGRRGDQESAKRAPFLSAHNLLEHVSPELSEQLAPVLYRLRGSTFVRAGYVAEALPGICEVYLRARDQGQLVGKQKQVGHAADILMRGLAKVGIVALVDEATGYQETRGASELQALLEKYVQEDFRPWVRVFPDAFFAELYRLQGWDYTDNHGRRPQYAGTFINAHVYGQLPDGVLEELRRVNPRADSGHRPRKFHQHLTVDTGSVHLDKQITAVLTLMQVSRTKEEFNELFARRFPGPQPRQVLRVVVGKDEQAQTLFELDDETIPDGA